MASQLKTDENLGRGIRRIAKKEIESIIEQLKERRLDQGPALHQARKNLKKVRATLRLVREQLGEQIFRRENRNFREAARALSPARDAQVLVKTLDKLRRSQKKTFANAGLDKLDRILLGRHREAVKTEAQKDEIEIALRAARHRAKHWPLKKLDWADLLDALEGSYRRARKAFRTVTARRADEQLHEWRKRVKDLWYQLRLLQPVCSEEVASLAEEMKRLSEYVGDDHDLMMLGAALSGSGLAARDSQVISHWIDARRRSLQASALKLGEELFAEKPARFAKHIAECRDPKASLD